MGLGWLFGSPRTNSKIKPESSLRVQTSIAGRPIPIGWGQFAVAPNLIWYGDFKATKHDGGGKGLGLGGGGKGGGTTYTYEAAVICALCEGPVQQILQVWNGPTPQTLDSLNLTAFLGTYSQTAWGYLTGDNQPIQEWHFVSTGSPPYTCQANFHGSPFADFGVIDQEGNNYKKVGSPANNFEYSVDTSTGIYTFYSAQAGAFVQIKYTAGDQPTQALAYRGIAYAAAGTMKLGMSPELPNMRFEIISTFNGAIPGYPDADPSEVVTDYLTNVHYGVGFPSARLGDFTTYQDYALASGLVVSPILVDQSEAGQFLSDLMAGTNSALVWNGSQLTAVPYGDTDITANGHTYTAPVAAIYSLTDIDFHQPQGSNPNSSGSGAASDAVQTVRIRKADQNNVIKVELLDRGNGYNPVVVEAKDDANINAFGLRVKDVIQAHYFAVPAAALASAHLLLGREQILRTFTFTVGPEYILLDPMDIVEITDANQGLSFQWVRIQEITENSDFSLTITAEEYLNGTGTIPLILPPENFGHQQNRNSPPPDTNTPIVLAGPYEIAQELEIWLVASGPSGWGGCYVWVSSDGTTYNNMGTMVGPCRQGLLSGSFASGDDPDTVNTLSVDLAESLGTLIAGTEQDADNANTLAYCDGELIAYSAATLVSGNLYDLDTYIRRGLYGTTISNHNSGTQFARLDDLVFKLPYDKSKIGTTIYVKLQPFNVWQAGSPDLSTITALPVTLPGIPPPGIVQNFSVQQNGEAVFCSWTDLDEAALKGYDILYALQGEDVDHAILITEASRQTAETTVGIPPGTWTIFIRGHDVADQLGPVSTADITVVNKNLLLFSQEYAPDFLGTIDGFRLTYDGTLVPECQQTTATLTVDNVFLKSTSSPSGFPFVTNPTYTPAEIDESIDSLVRAWFASRCVTLGGYSGSCTVGYGLDYWLSSGSDSGVFVPWTIGLVTARYFIPQLQGVTSGAPNFLNSFQFNIDAPTQTFTVNNFAVSSSGTTVLTYSDYGIGPFHGDPNIQVSPSDGVGTSGGALNITTTSATIQEFTGSTLISGTVNILITGA